MVREYKHRGGYIGRMYGDATFEVVNPEGKVILKTTKRNFDSYKGLIRATDDVVRMVGRRKR